MKKLRAERRAWLALRWAQIKAKAVLVWSEMNEDQRFVMKAALHVVMIVVTALVIIKL